MQRLTEIKNRIKSIADTRKITGAMETIAGAKLRKAMQKHESNQLFFEKTLELIRDIARGKPEEAEKFFENTAPDARAVYLVAASDKGMAGAYNSNVLKHAWSLVERERAEYSIFAVGRSARDFFAKKGCAVGVELPEPSLERGKADAQEIAELVLRLFLEGRAGRVYLSYTHLYENNAMVPKTLTLLPLGELGMRNEELGTKNCAVETHSVTPHSSLLTPHSSTQPSAVRHPPLHFDPSSAEVLDLLVPQYLMWVIYGAFLHASACEHYARRLAMSSASKNADEILENLTNRYHRARQEAITNELNEIITTTGGLSEDAPVSVSVTGDGLRGRFNALSLPAAAEFALLDGRLHFAPRTDSPLYAELFYAGAAAGTILKLTVVFDPGYTISDSYAYSDLPGAITFNGLTLRYKTDKTYALATAEASGIRYYWYFESDKPERLVEIIERRYS